MSRRLIPDDAQFEASDVVAGMQQRLVGLLQRHVFGVFVLDADNGVAELQSHSLRFRFILDLEKA